jgi:hypothetical protein
LKIAHFEIARRAASGLSERLKKVSCLTLTKQPQQQHKNWTMVGSSCSSIQDVPGEEGNETIDSQLAHFFLVKFEQGTSKTAT